MTINLLKVKNVGKTPLELKHDVDGDMTIKPGQEVIVSQLYAISQFGNPGARNNGKERVRDVEYAKIQARWGFFPGIEKAIEKETGDKNYNWETLQPHIEVHDMEGNRIYMLTEDPTGVLNGDLGAAKTEATEGQFVNAQIAALTAQVEQLQALILANQPDKLASTPSEPFVRVDDGETEGTPGIVRVDDSGDDEDTPFDPNNPEATLKNQAARNAQRDEIPKPQVRSITKDKPRTPRSGG